MKILCVLGLLLWTCGAQAAPPLSCRSLERSADQVVIAHAGNGLVSVEGTVGGDVGTKISCLGELISAGSVPGFGENVETFWFRANASCPFEFLQLDDSAYRAGRGPMRMTCSEKPCAIEAMTCELAGH